MGSYNVLLYTDRYLEHLPVVEAIAGLPPNFSSKCVAQLTLPSPLWPPPPPLERSSWIDS